MSGTIVKKIETRVDILEHDFYDNGGVGIKTMVGNHEKIVQRIKGVWWFMGVVGLTNLVAIVLYLAEKIK